MTTRRFLRSWRSRIGLAILGLFILVAIAGPPFVDHVLQMPADAIDYNALHRPPGGDHPLGTTNSGQDVLSQVIVGARSSVAVGVTSAVLATVLAIGVGVTGGFLGGRTDQLLTVLTNLFITLPSFALILIVAGYVQGVTWVVVAFLIGIFEWPGGARYLRSQTLSLRNRDFAVAMRALGETRIRLIFSEILPHLTGIISAMFLRAMVAGVMAEAGLAFLGISAETISWGTMIEDSRDQSAIRLGYWWWYLPPGLCLALIGTATALINFGIDEISNPRLQGKERKLVRQFDKLRRKSFAADRTTAEGRAAEKVALR
ncbi:ABC transporter permease [Microlunatus soli]|uniref:Peptide/nickel transport system permease protein n=1 Tax=Microlunatus soli TaxID=630515 RepID=A0A1H1WCY9_9ACTN|nr:ABC transporter permease [Microlunatus soli]SDS94236.1 peptide/nickel transport system permease protein [Microlunatus soli]